MSISAQTAYDRKYGAHSVEGGRFAGLREALKVTKGSSIRLAAHRAEAKGLLASGEIDIAELVASQPSSHRNRATKAREVADSRAATAKASSPATTQAPKPKAAAAPPPRKLGRAETVANAVRTDPKLAGMEDIGLHILDDPDLKGLSGDGIVRCMQGIDPAKYRAAMAEEKRKASVAHADGVWSRARASIDGTGVATTAPAKNINPDAQGRKLSASEARADAVWDRARASIDPDRHPVTADEKPAVGHKPSAVDAIWERAYRAAR